MSDGGGDSNVIKPEFGKSREVDIENGKKREEDSDETSFEEIIRRNRENAERVAKERSKENRNVLRSNRISPRTPPTRDK